MRPVRAAPKPESGVGAHGSNFMVDHFQKQIRFWGLAPNFAFVSEPQTNGVIERFFRTLKEQSVQ